MKLKKKKTRQSSIYRPYTIAENQLGKMYDFGDGVPQDKAEAFNWYLKASEKGFAGAYYGLALCYFYGRGVARDKKLAKRWLEKATRQGNIEAQLFMEKYF